MIGSHMKTGDVERGQSLLSSYAWRASMWEKTTCTERSPRANTLNSMKAAAQDRVDFLTEELRHNEMMCRNYVRTCCH